MHLAIFIVFGPLIALATALYGLPPLLEYLAATGSIPRSLAAFKLNFPPVPLAYALGFLPALATSRVDNILHDMQIATPLRIVLTGVAAAMFMPLITLFAAIAVFGNPKMLLVVGLIGFLPGLLCSLLGTFAMSER